MGLGAGECGDDDVAFLERVKCVDHVSTDGAPRVLDSSFVRGEWGAVEGREERDEIHQKCSTFANTA